EVQCYQILREEAALMGNFKQYEQTNRRLSEAMDRLRLEQRAEELDDRLLMEFSNSTAHKPHLHDLAGEFIRELEELRRRCDTFTINRLYFRTRIVAYQARFEYTQALQVCDEAEEYYRLHPEFSSRLALAGLA